LTGENVRQIRENTHRVREVLGEAQSLWGGSDEKGLGEGLGTFSHFSLFCPNPPTSSVLLLTPPEPFAYSPGSGGQNHSKTRYHGKKGGGQGCVGESWE